MHGLQDRLSRILAQLEQGLVERRREVRLALLAALAGEHTLLIGPPGTAKSELARRLHLAFVDAAYFERLLTRFSVPEELFGPLSISALEQDRYERHTAGFLPEASIAFIDEVFKANSAILNALLTLLNEREFDNGAGRMRCPLISVIGATNVVPDDEVAEAFFDRFLLRLPVSPVSVDGFRRLIDAGVPTDPLRCGEALGADDRVEIAVRADAVALPDEVAGLLVELRQWLAAEGRYVSDRRWVKIVRLLRTACACEGRQAVSIWDLWLLPWCIGTGAEDQAGVSQWLQHRLGVRQAHAPERLTRVVEAFEAQLSVEREAHDLDYDDAGRLRFSPTGLAEEVGDAKGGGQALRMSAGRRRRYGPMHVAARTGQIDAVLERIAAYADEIASRRRELARYLAASLWMDAGFAASTDVCLGATAAAVAGLAERMKTTRAGFEALPRLPVDSGPLPEPVFHEPV